MLTVKEINEVSFGKAGFSGYKPEDVDNFIDEVVESFTQLQAEKDDALQQCAQQNQQMEELNRQVAELKVKNSELQKKLGILAQKIESYREEEDGIKEAILSAQRMGKEALQDAKGKAAVMMADAEENAKKLGAIQVKIAAKAGSNGKLFGSVTSKEISDALHEQFDLTIEKQKIVQAEPIKSFGAYEVKCKLGYEVTGTIHVLVIEEK